MADKQMTRLCVSLIVIVSIAVAATAGCSGHSSPQQVRGDFATVGGGQDNRANDYATVCGGSHNTASAVHATVGGGSHNTARVQYSVVSGGANNTASAIRATVGGGYGNTASHLDATIGGGAANTASGTHTTVGGGSHNTASGRDATVSGGYGNTASGSQATTCGGYQNTAHGFGGTVGGGAGNMALETYATVGGGLGNRATGIYATVGGGYSNAGTGSYSTVSGGLGNEAAGDYSFASGHRAIVAAAHEGTFLYADASDLDFHSAAVNEFAVRATGGVRFVTAIDRYGNPIAGVELAAGSGSWSSLSSREMKANASPVDGGQILLTLAELPISTWNYVGQDPSIRHAGPMAQDFYAAFGIGEDDEHISTVDADGVALAAIQGLYHLVREKDAQLMAQQRQITALEARVTALEQANQVDSSPTRPISAGTEARWLLFGALCLAGVVVERIGSRARIM
jgi:hypothetical protein